MTTSVPGATVTPPRFLSATALSVSVPSAVDPGLFALTIENAEHQRSATTIVVDGDTSGSEVAARAGVSAFPGMLWAAPAERDADTRAVADSGARWTSLDLDWKSIQSTSTDFGWARGTLNNGGFDGAVKAARAQGLRILGTITYSPKWASPDCADQNGTYVGHCLPDAAHVNDFANFARAAAQRYGSQSTASDPALRGSITAWQISIDDRGRAGAVAARLLPRVEHHVPRLTGPLLWKATRDDPPDSTRPANSQLWNNLGLLRLDHSPKPAFAAMQDVTTRGVTGLAQGGHCY